MKRHWIYAALTLGGFGLFLFGALIGRLSVTGGKIADVANPKSELTQAEQEVLDVLKRPSARKLFEAAASDPAAEIRVITSRSKSELKTTGFAVSSASAEDFAIAMQDLELLSECGLITALRKLTDRGNAPRETIVYALTPAGHRVAKMLVSKQ